MKKVIFYMEFSFLLPCYILLVRCVFICFILYNSIAFAGIFSSNIASFKRGYDFEIDVFSCSDSILSSGYLYISPNAMLYGLDEIEVNTVIVEHTGKLIIPEKNISVISKNNKYKEQKNKKTRCNTDKTELLCFVFFEFPIRAPPIFF